MLTWRESIVYKLDPTTFDLVDQLKWNKQGWGLTQNGTHMFTTDGSDTIYVVDSNFKVVDQKQITNQVGRRLYNMN
jgi:glutamine cyclotransferase